MHKLRAKITDVIVKRGVFDHFDEESATTLENRFPSRRPRGLSEWRNIFNKVPRKEAHFLAFLIILFATIVAHLLCPRKASTRELSIKIACIKTAFAYFHLGVKIFSNSLKIN